MLQSVTVPQMDLAAYRSIVGDQRIDELIKLAEPLKGARVLHVNATGFGGGVAELLSTLVPLMNSVGLQAEWRLMEGAPELWDVTKSIHNLLQGATMIRDDGPHAGQNSAPAGGITAHWSRAMEEVWERYNERTADAFEGQYDFVVMHDPQPAGALKYLLRRDANARTTRWIWRCHIDLTQAQKDIWNFLCPFLEPYNAAIFTMQQYVKPDLPIKEVALIAPAIDALSPKNVDMPRDQVEQIVRHFGVDPARPIMTQVSRFDPWKDPLGVIDAYKQIKRDMPDLQLVMIASMAADDPEGWHFFEMTARHAGEDADIHLLTNISGVGNVEVNAFQRASNVLLQKSIREGFALTVSEGLWKGRPVVAGNVGGIPLQIKSGENGYLVDSIKECVERTRELLQDPRRADAMGQAGREWVREKFLMTRDLSDYLQLFRRIAA